jgi:hypothetical protein
MRVKQMEKTLSKKDNTKVVHVHVSDAVYRAWCNGLTTKDIVMFLQPATERELLTVGDVDRGDFVSITIKLPLWWIEWYKSLTLRDKLRFAKLVEERMRRYKIL